MSSLTGSSDTQREKLWYTLRATVMVICVTLLVGHQSIRGKLKIILYRGILETSPIWCVLLCIRRYLLDFQACPDFFDPSIDGFWFHAVCQCIATDMAFTRYTHMYNTDSLTYYTRCRQVGARSVINVGWLMLWNNNSIRKPDWDEDAAKGSQCCALIDIIVKIYNFTAKLHSQANAGLAKRMYEQRTGGANL